MVITVLVVVCFLHGCTTGVEPSPEAGIIRVTLKSDDADTVLVILGDSTRFSRVDWFYVVVSEGRLFKGANYADLYRTPSLERISSDTVNLLQRQWLDGRLVTPSDPLFEIPAYQTRYAKKTIFEWYVPPGSYDRLQFGLTGIEVFVAIPRRFRNPLERPKGVSRILNFPSPITIESGKTTQIDMEIYPFRSIRRFRDSYLFDPQINIERVKIF